MNPAPHAAEGQDRIWDFFQNDAPGSFAGSRSRLLHLLKWLNPSQRVLNIGCGSGIFEELALARGIDVHSLDPGERTIQSLRDRLGLGDKAKVGYIQKQPFPDAHFDAVVASEVFEHLTPEVLEAGLREIRRVLKPGGMLLGTVPSREDLNAQVVVCPCCGQRFHRWGHEQAFDAATVRRILSGHLEVREVEERPFFTWAVLNWKGKAASAVKWLLWKAGSHGSNENVCFVAVRQAGADAPAPGPGRTR